MSRESADSPPLHIINFVDTAFHNLSKHPIQNDSALRWRNIQIKYISTSVFFWSEIYIRFLFQKNFAASRRFFTIISRFSNEIPYKKAPQAKIFRYQTSNIMIFFVKLTEKSPKSNINPQNIYTIFEPGQKSRRYIYESYIYISIKSHCMKPLCPC